MKHPLEHRWAEAEPVAPEALLEDLRALYDGGVQVPAFVESQVLAAARRHLRHRRIVRRMWRGGRVAAAACVALAAVWWLHGTAPEGDRLGTTARLSAGSVEALPEAGRLVMGYLRRLNGEAGLQDGSDETPVPLLAGEAVAADDGRRLGLRIWDRHEIVLEPGARLAANRSRDGGCVLALAGGRIGVTVRRAVGEGVFRVVTPQASLTVTGTVFAVSAGFDRTRLSVREGVVELGVPRCVPQAVCAGQTFETDGIRLTRLEPGAADALLAAAEAVQDPVAAILGSPGCRERFAPLWLLGEYLRERGVVADDLTLLAMSGDLWCVQQGQRAGLPATVHRRAGLERAARSCGYEVVWLSGENLQEVSDAAARHVARGDLVLAYGGPGRTVQRVAGAEAAGWRRGWSYRFLGEPEASPLALCLIRRSTRPTEPIRVLAEQAAEDIPHLLAAAEDPEYLLGRRALRGWADALAGSEGIALHDPLIEQLSLVAKLSVVCQERLAGAGAAGAAVAAWQSICGGLEQLLEAAFTNSVFERTACGRMERQRLVEDCVRWSEAMAAAASGGAGHSERHRSMPGA